MHGGDGFGRLSAAEEGEQKAAAADADADQDLQPPAALVLESAADEPRPAAGDAAADASWHGGGGAGLGVRRRLFLGPTPTSGGTGTSEIEELPPSPPPPSRRRLPAPTNADGALMSAAAVAGLQGRLMEMDAALDSRLREIELLSRRRGEDDDADEHEPEPEVAGAAEARLLQSMRRLDTIHQAVSGLKDAALALHLQTQEMCKCNNNNNQLLNKENNLEEFWKPVVPGPQRNNNNSSSKFVAKEMKALEEFWKPVPVPQRPNNRKIKWKRIISLMASASWVVLCISSWTRLSVNSNLTHIVGAMSVLWMLRGTYSRCQRFRTSRTISRHVPTLICVCFWLLVLYVLFLILRPIHGTFVGWLGKHH